MAAYRGNIKMVLLDVDGVLTDGSLHIGAAGELYKTFNVKDGLAVALLHLHGIKVGILSGKTSAALLYRARELKFDVVETGSLDKLTAYHKILQDHALVDAEIAYIGDDVVDLPVLRKVGITYAPADAHSLVLASVTYVLHRVGGAAVVREMVEHLLALGGLSIEQMYEPLLDKLTNKSANQPSNTPGENVTQ